MSLLMTPKILARSWNLTSLIRDPAQKAEILELGKDQPGKLDVVVESLEVKGVEDAGRILDNTKPDWVVWSAGMFDLFVFVFEIGGLREGEGVRGKERLRVPSLLGKERGLWSCARLE